MAFSLKDYTDLQELRIGGMGKIFAATQTSLNRRVVIKEMTPNSGDPSQNKRFENEAKSAAALDHENIIKVYDFGIENGKFYIVMEYVDGSNLDDLLNTPGFPKEVALMIVFQALKGIHYSHQHAIIHRDVKPSNILISKTGTVKVADFGLAYAASTPSKLTQTGAVVGTPHFMAPEQISGTPIKDNRVDIWAVGVLLYKSLVGEYPFTGDSLPSLCYNIINNHEKDIRKIVPALPEYLAERIKDCLVKNPDKRPTSLMPLIKGLQDFFFGIGVRDVPLEIQQYLTLPSRYLRKSLLDKRTIYANIPLLRANPKTYLIIFIIATCVAISLFFYTWKQRNSSSKSDDRTQSISTTNKQVDTAIKNEPVPRNEYSNGQTSTEKSMQPARTNQIKPAVIKEKSTQASSIPVNKAHLMPSTSAPDTIAQAPIPVAAAALPESGTVSIKVEPATAEILIDGKRVPSTEAGAILKLPIGKHHLTIKTTGYITYDQDLSIVSNSNHDISISLKPAATGTVEIQSFPKADIYIDGTLQGKTPLENPLSIPIGKHTLVLKAAGYADHEELLDIKKGEIKRVKVRLEKK